MADQTGFGRLSRLGTILLPVIGVIRRIGSEIDPNFASVTKRQNMSLNYVALIMNNWFTHATARMEEEGIEELISRRTSYITALTAIKRHKRIAYLALDSRSIEGDICFLRSNASTSVDSSVIEAVQYGPNLNESLSISI